MRVAGEGGRESKESRGRGVMKEVWEKLVRRTAQPVTAGLHAEGTEHAHLPAQNSFLSFTHPETSWVGGLELGRSS